ncbi:hypothetical protein GGR52DRAFT_590773 [Hypoxylon sp. FL1284]|nr:hypothetical protein GGR52DRAFT_590773 [Hypoxylon sp. FL1284]
MPKLYIPPLHVHMYKGFHNGMKWETQDELDENGNVKFRLLLHHPHSFRISKVITKGLKQPRPSLVSHALGDLYSFATKNIDKALFLNTALRPGERKRPRTQAFAEALDDFREAFFDYYTIDHVRVAKGEGYGSNQEDIEATNDIVSTNQEVRDKYFPKNLTHHNAEGDGCDKLITKPRRDPVAPHHPVPEDDTPDVRELPDDQLFFYDTEVKTTFRDVFMSLPIYTRPCDPRETVKVTMTKASETFALPALGEQSAEKRSYNAFMRYRESGAGVAEESEEGYGTDAGLSDTDDLDDDGDDAMGGMGGMGGMGVEEEVPDVKRLKISDD